MWGRLCRAFESICREAVAVACRIEGASVRGRWLVRCYGCASESKRQNGKSLYLVQNHRRFRNTWTGVTQDEIFAGEGFLNTKNL